ncbi:MAG: PAS domain S-box protein [Bacteroidota bacterium]
MPASQTLSSPTPGAAPAAADAPQAAVERALVQISRFLVSSAGADLDQVLALLGDALEADSVYFVLAAETAPPHVVETDPYPTAPSYLAGRVLSWTRRDAPEAATVPMPSPEDSGGAHRVCLVDGDDGRRALAVPLLAEDERFIGYLGIERAGLADPLHAPLDRILSVLGDVLGNHLSRLAAEEAREQTEQRWQSLVDRHPDPTLVVVEGTITYANAAAARLLGAEDATALTDRPFDDFLSARDIARVLARQAVQLRSPLPYPFEHAVVRLDGDERIVEAVCVPFPGIRDGIQQVLRDITDRKESEERYRTFVETISEGVWRIELDAPVARTATPRVQAEHVLHHGRIAELNPTMTRMFWGESAPIGARLGDLLRSYGSSLVRAFAEAGHHLVGHEIAVRLDDQSMRHFSINAVGRFERDELVGVWGSCTEITERVEMERSMVGVLEEQQERIGRDLHDSVGQLLTGVRMLSEGLVHTHEGDETETTVSRIAAYAAEALDRVRAICRGLVPPQLYSEGAVGALDELVDHVDALGATRCLFRHDGKTDLYDPDLSLQVYRIAQEALSNALRHAEAETVWVYFGRDEGDILVEVEDDGVGFELDAERAHSIGLYSMHRRAHSIGATLAIETRPGAGTTVRMTIPAGALPPAARLGGVFTDH